MNLNHHYDLAVIGAGPAGMAAAIEASRNNMKVLFWMTRRQQVVRSTDKLTEIIIKMKSFSF